MSDIVGKSLGAYEIIEQIGQGGMANVYRALQTSVGREVAIKVLPTYFLQDQTFLDRFYREIKVIAHLQHPRILPVYDCGEQDGRPYIVMAYIRGGTLADRIKESPEGMPLEEVVRLVAQIAEGLDYAHEQGVIHRDFKPANVLIEAKGNVYLADFGIAKATQETVHLTEGGVLGTPHYIAPETVLSGKLSRQVDIYALGVTVYEMVTGIHPYDAETPVGVMMAHANQPIPNAREIRPRLPSAIQQVIAWAMAKDPAERPHSAGEMAQLLERALIIAGPDTMVVTEPQTAAQTAVAVPQTTPVEGNGNGAGLTVEAAPQAETGAENAPESALPQAEGPRKHVTLAVIAGLAAIGLVIILAIALAVAVTAANRPPTPTPTLTPAVQAMR